MIAPAPFPIPEYDPYEGFHAATAHICRNIDKAGKLWNQHLRPLRDAAVRLCQIDGEIFEEHCIFTDREGKIANASERSLNKILIENQNAGKYLNPADLITLNQTMAELNEDYARVTNDANQETVDKPSIKSQLESMRAKVDTVYQEAKKVIEIISAKFDEFVDNFNRDFSDLDKFFTESFSDCTSAVYNVYHLSNFAIIFFIKPKLESKAHSPKEGQLINSFTELDNVFLFKAQMSELDREKDFDYLDKNVRTLAGQTIPEIIRERVQEFRDGIEAWYQQAQNSYAEALQMFQT